MNYILDNVDNDTSNNPTEENSPYVHLHPPFKFGSPADDNNTASRVSRQEFFVADSLKGWYNTDRKQRPANVAGA